MSLNVSGFASGLHGGRSAFQRSEFSEGADLNGDGDLSDNVVGIYHAGTGAVLSTGLATFAFGGPAWDEHVALVAVDENDQGGADLNGDGDTLDKVLAAVDMKTGASTSLGHAVDFTAPAIPLGARFGYSASELATTGGGRDLNGDGDLNDFVFFVYDHTTGTSTGPSLACASNLLGGATPNANEAVASGDWVLFLVPELDQGVDLDGDGDTGDLVVHAYQPSTGDVVNSGLAADDLYASTRFAAFLADEAATSMDLDGDGSLDDFVLTTFDPVTEVFTTSVVAADPSVGLVVLEASILAAVPESDVDLNGDGDVEAADAVLHMIVDGTATNLSLAVDGLLGEYPFGAVRVPEVRQGSDLNGDGDLLDGVIFAVDLRSGATQSLVLATEDLLEPRQLSGTYLAVDASEAADGIDHNLDGDEEDTVLFVYSFQFGLTKNTRFAPSHVPHSPFSWSEGVLLFTIDEQAQGSSDLNMDGDTLDIVAAMHCANSGKTRVLRLAVQPAGVGTPFALEADVGLLSVFEPHQGHHDLNGDGDALDAIVFDVRSDFGNPLATNLGGGTPGTSGFIPRLEGLGSSGVNYILRVRGGPSGALGLLVGGVSQGAIPLIGGTLFVAPIDFVLLHTLSSGQAGTGSALLELDLPPMGSFTFQAAYMDSNAVGGFALTNGLTVE